MNSIALRFAAAVSVVLVVSLLLAIVLKRGALEQVQAAVARLLKLTYLDFVEMVIFLRPWKAYVEQTGLVIWVALVYAVGRYMLLERPTIFEIPGIFIPAIGYVYLVSILYIVRSVLRVVRKGD